MELQPGLARESELVEPNPPVGVVFDVKRFEKPSSGGCARGWQVVGWDDFPYGGFQLDVGRGVQRARIDETSTTHGEVGIERHVHVNPGETYQLTARLQIKEKTGQFAARIALVARREDGLLLEAFDSVYDVSSEAVWLSVEATVPERSSLLSPEFKVQTSEPGEAGMTEIYNMRLERIR